MRKLLFITLFGILLQIAFAAQHSYAASPTAPTPSPHPPSGGECSWDEFLEMLGCEETGFVCSGGSCPKSCDAQWTVLSDRAHDPSYGKWQFTPTKWAEVTGAQYPQCAGQANAISVECRPVQRWATIQNMEDAVAFFERNNWCGPKLGQPITGTHQGTTLSCTINKSGLLSAYHNAQSNACNFAGGTSQWSSQINWRICNSKDIPFPENCTPSDSSAPSIPSEVTPGTPNIQETPFEHLDHLEGLAEVLKTHWVGGLQLMTNQLSAVMMQQVQAVGKFFDVKHQLETQRIMQTKFAQAHKDYHPSEQICEIGTFSRALLNSEQRARLTKVAITEKMMTRGLSSGDGTTTTGNQSDRKTRLTQFIETFCSTEDNARSNTLLCGNTSGDADQQNIDIDFTRLIDSPLTLDIDLTQSGAEDPDNPTPAEEREEKTEMNVFAFLNYIFLHDTIPVTGREKTTMEKFVVPYQDARALMAMRSVAHNSFAELIAMKSSGPKIPTSGTGQESNSPYLKALMIELGMEPAEVEEFIGDNPSYYAQMEILTKKIYQNPEFVANLYDKPANVRRIRAAMTAIKLMQDRDIHEALMRREMLISMILELQLRQKQDVLSDDINSVVGAPTLKGRSLTSY